MRKKAKNGDPAQDAPIEQQAEPDHDLDLSYEDFVKAHGLAPLNDIKTACRVANVGLTRFYELVDAGVFVLVPNGSRRNVTAKNLHKHYQKLIAAVQREPAA
ncbi:hypothetical protein IVB14_23280 [Bradyrhizobium sp. 180]|uniref:hypothetical protein n=1 Tax=unclassified Bradyrhizobium TaxID=2631580 RepID=UPI001FFA461C|nr:MULTISPECIES: hypothetical protein [unclassified Bradyrhizobium]MCK1493273.1 hypothetical protein [Bradyrhizobium sp. 180]MCK1529001.1 hypothetical protein [Bradyrhizobium sp. 182]MCK1595864.1 hypothetical protein [Bradyrhizobium sp. 164]